MRAKVTARAPEARCWTKRVITTPETARLARGPTRPMDSPMKLRTREASMGPVGARPALGAAPGSPDRAGRAGGGPGRGGSSMPPLTRRRQSECRRPAVGPRWPGRRSLPWCSTPHQRTPHQRTPHQRTPHQRTPHQRTPHRTPHQRTPHQRTPHQRTPHQRTPHQRTPHQRTPHQRTPHQRTPHQGLPTRGLPTRGLPTRGLPVDAHCRGRVGPGPLGPVDLYIGQPELAQAVLQRLFGLAQAPLEPGDQAAQRIDGHPSLAEQGRLLGQVHRRQLEQPVAVVGHHHLHRRIGQFDPHGRHLLGQLLLARLGRPATASTGSRRRGPGPVG